jgi:oxidoreductase
MEAIVAGSTGATGQAIVKELLATSSITRVYAMTRKVTDPSYFSADSNQQEKLKIVNFDSVISGTTTIPSKIELAFCCLGSAPHSIESDLIAPSKLADYLSRRPQPPSKVLLISADGANSNSWLSYPRTIGKREEYFKSKFSDNLVIFRPRLLLRNDKSRSIEKFASWFLPKSFKMNVENLAKSAVNVMINPTNGHQIYSHSEILAS